MGRYAMLKKEFKFLAELYGFKIFMKQKLGAYYYIVWTNPNKNIMVLYDEREKDPLTIRVYDIDSLGFDAEVYKDEFVHRIGSPREKIHRASEWLQKAILDERISV